MLRVNIVHFCLPSITLSCSESKLKFYFEKLVSSHFLINVDFVGLNPPLSSRVSISVENRIVKLSKYIRDPVKLELWLKKINILV